MKKRLLATLLSLVMVLTMLPVSAFAADTTLNFTAVASTVETDTKVTLEFDAGAIETGATVWYKPVTDVDNESDPGTLTDTDKKSYEKFEDTTYEISEWDTNNTHIAVAVVAASATADGTVSKWGTAEIKTVATGLTVEAVRTTPNATFKVTDSKNDAVSSDLYYRTSASEITDAPFVGDVVDTTASENPWQDASSGITLEAADEYIEVVKAPADSTDSDKNKIEAWGTAAIIEALGELTVTVGDDNVISVEGANNAEVSGAKLYNYTGTKDAFNAAKATWNASTKLADVESTLGTAINGTAVTNETAGSFIVAAQVAGEEGSETLVAVGISDAIVANGRNIKIGASSNDKADLEDFAISKKTYTYQVDDAEATTVYVEATGKDDTETQAITIKAGATKDDADAANVTDGLVTLEDDGNTIIVVTMGSDEYVITVSKTPAEDFTKPGIVIATTADAEAGDVLAADAAFTADASDPTTYNASASVSSTATVVFVTTDGTVSVEETDKGASWDDNSKKVTLATTGETTTIKVVLSEKNYIITLTKESGGADTVADLTIETATVDTATGKVTLVVKKAGTEIKSYSYKFADTAGTKPETQETPTANEYKTTATGTDITGGTAGKYIVVVQLDAETGKIVSWGSAKLTETPVVSGFTALTVTEGTGDNAGKLMVTVADGEVPDGLQYVILNSDPQWTKDTTADAVNEALTGKEPQAYVEGTTKVPDQTKADQFVVVYKLGQEKLEAYGMLKVAAQEEERLITVKANNEGDSLIGFVKDTTDYTVVVAQSVSSITVAASEGGAITDGNDNSGVVDKPADAETKGAVSTVKVTFGETVYTITLLWPKDKDAIDTPDTEVKPTVDANSEEDKSTVDLTTNAAEETKVLVAIGNTAAMNEGQAQKAPVSIDATATTPANATATTEVKLPVAVSNALVETEVPVEIKTDAGTVTLPSVAIEKAQGDEADVLTVVVENTSAETVQPEDDVRASFKVTIEKNGVATEDVTGLAEANWITLVFAVPNTVIDGVDEPILAWDDNGTYKELESSDYEKGATETVFTAKTSHLTDFVVIGKALLSPAPSTDEFAISVQGEELVPGFSAGVLNYEVTTDAESATIEVKNAASGSTVTVNGQTYSAPVKVTVTEGTKVEVVYTLNGATTGTKYTITFKKKTQEEQPLDELEISIDGSATDKIEFDDSHIALVKLSATQSSFTFTVPADTKVEATDGVTAEIDVNGLVTVKATANGTVKFTLNGTEYTLNVTKTPASQTGSYTMEWKYMKFADAANQFKQVTLKNTDANKVYLVEVIDSNYGSGQNNFLVVDGNGNDVSFYLLKSASRVKVWEVVEADFVNATGDGINYPQSVNPGILDLA